MPVAEPSSCEGWLGMSITPPFRSGLAFLLWGLAQDNLLL